jgi:hypothetical protein
MLWFCSWGIWYRNIIFCSLCMLSVCVCVNFTYFLLLFENRRHISTKLDLKKIMYFFCSIFVWFLFLDFGLRFVDRSANESGEVEFYKNGTWNALCIHTRSGGPQDPFIVDVICRQLGLPTWVKYKMHEYILLLLLKLISLYLQVICISICMYWWILCKDKMLTMFLWVKVHMIMKTFRFYPI